VHAVQDRVRIEAEVLAEEGRHAPEHVPAMLDYDGRMYTIAMAYIGPPVSQMLWHINRQHVIWQTSVHCYCRRPRIW
jgi:5-methylthioribose kinase